MERNHFIVILIAVVAVLAIASAFVIMTNDSEDPVPIPDPVEMDSYKDGIYNGKVQPGEIILTETDLETMGSPDMVLFGSDWIDRQNPVALGSRIISLIETGKIVASTDPDVFRCLDALYPYTYEPGASIVAMQFDKENGWMRCYSGSADHENTVIQNLIAWANGSMGLTRWFFNAGGNVETKVVSQIEHDFGRWGKLTMGGSLGSFVQDGKARMMDVRTMMYHKEYEMGIDSIKLYMKVDSPDQMLDSYAPCTSWYNYGHREINSFSMVFDNSYYWDRDNVDIIDRSNLGLKFMSVECDTSKWGHAYQNDLTYGIGTRCDVGSGPFKDTGILSLTTELAGVMDTLKIETVSQMPV